MPRHALDVQDSIVQSIVAIMPHPWKRIVLNFEVDAEEENHSSSIFFHIVQTSSGELAEDEEPRLPMEVRSLLFELHGVMAAAASRWGTCDLTIEANGRYTFTFDYGLPKRLNGILDEASYGRFKTYLATYKAELAATGTA